MQHITVHYLRSWSLSLYNELWRCNLGKLICCEIWFLTYKSPIYWTQASFSQNNDYFILTLVFCLRSPCNDEKNCLDAFLFTLCCFPALASFSCFPCICWWFWGIYSVNLTGFIYSTQTWCSRVAFLACKGFFAFVSQSNHIQGNQ